MLAPEARLYRVPAGARKSLIVVNSRLPADLLSRRPGARREAPRRHLRSVGWTPRLDHHGRKAMTTYIALLNLTEAGIKAAKDSPRRLDAPRSYWPTWAAR
jgi:hypothetical protein